MMLIYLNLMGYSEMTLNMLGIGSYLSALKHLIFFYFYIKDVVGGQTFI